MLYDQHDYTYMSTWTSKHYAYKSGMFYNQYFCQTNHVFQNFYRTVLCSLFAIRVFLHSFILSSSYLILFIAQDHKFKITHLKSFGSQAVKRKDYLSASSSYTQVWQILCSSFPASNFSKTKNACEHAYFQTGLQPCSYASVVKSQGLVHGF